jgi:hypothetical protein
VLIYLSKGVLIYLASKGVVIYLASKGVVIYLASKGVLVYLASKDSMCPLPATTRRQDRINDTKLGYLLDLALSDCRSLSLQAPDYYSVCSVNEMALRDT